MPVPPSKKWCRPVTDMLEEHPYMIKLNIKLSQLKKQLLAIYDIANCDLILSDARTGVNDFHVNEQFAKKLDDISKRLASLSKQVTDKASSLHDSIDKAVDTKAQLQDCVYVGKVLEYSKQCDVIKERNTRPKHFKTLGEFRIKRELLDTSDEEEDVSMSKKQKKDQASFTGDPDGHFQFMKQNENDAAAHTFICDLCEGVF